jgi:hypothetical protein
MSLVRLKEGPPRVATVAVMDGGGDDNPTAGQGRKGREKKLSCGARIVTVMERQQTGGELYEGKQTQAGHALSTFAWQGRGGPANETSL